MNDEPKNLHLNAVQILSDWLQSCLRGGKISRNTIAIGIVVLDHLRQKGIVTKEMVVSAGGEIKNARSGLKNVLLSYGLPDTYLKEVTTRQGHQDGQRLLERFQWGAFFADLSDAERDTFIQELVASQFVAVAQAWLKRQNLQLHVDLRQSPTTWIRLILEMAKQRSGGVVEQHLAGAKLTRRFSDRVISNFPAHAGDKQTARVGDFHIAQLVYHVTAAPSRSLIQKCADNIRAGYYPILLVPSEQENRARILAQEDNIEPALSIISIESFIALNIIELATDEHKEFFDILREIIQIYNARLEEVETDLSLQIDLL